MRSFNDAQEILESTHLVQRFLDLVKIDTQSSEKPHEKGAFPSSPNQMLALQKLVELMTDVLRLSDVTLDENGYLFATLPANVENAPTIGLIAHIDTAPDFSGAGVNPILHQSYDGSAIRLASGDIIDPTDNPQLAECVGDTIITTDGSTLLGADDKAGVAEILAVVEYLQAHPDIHRPTLRIAITPDEEIGRGVERFDIEAFGADCAYTLDGSFAGEINGETFSADGATVTFTGVAVHPGYAKNKLVNALRWAAKFVTMLPMTEAPESTEGREGFYHPTRIEGNASKATVNLILRDFDDRKLAKRGEYLNVIKSRLLEEEPRLCMEVAIARTYRNMANGLEERPEIMQRLIRAVELTGIEPLIKPIRGGTDGSGLTEKGLPTPNIFAGGMNFHGPREWVSTRVMGLAVCTVLNLVQIWSGEKNT
jgi:tripeptide aminopeptidase